jgi:hypothetical protein
MLDRLTNRCRPGRLARGPCVRHCHERVDAQGLLIQDGPRPEFAELYGAVEMPTASYRERTIQNVRDSDSTIWFGRTTTPGAKTTLQATRLLGKGGLQIYPNGPTRPSHVVRWLQANPHIEVLNIAGNRESKDPAIGDRVERFLSSVFRRLGFKPVE